MLNDIEIAQQAKMKKISAIAKDRLGIPEDELEAFGHYKAKISLPYLNTLKEKKDGKLILVTAISPTPAGEGKTTTTVGLGDALNLIGKKTMICLREPSLGPVFGMKGGAAGVVLHKSFPWKISIYISLVIFRQLPWRIIYWLQCWTIIFIMEML